MNKKNKRYVIFSSISFYLDGEFLTWLEVSGSEWSCSRSWDGKRYIAKRKADGFTIEFPLDEVCVSEWTESAK